VSDSIWIGLGNPDVSKSKGYTLDEMDNSSLFGICSMGIVMNEFDSQSFVFGTGDVIEI